MYSRVSTPAAALLAAVLLLTSHAMAQRVSRPLAPSVRPSIPNSAPKQPSTASVLPTNLFAPRVAAPSSTIMGDMILGAEAIARRTADVGGLLQDSGVVSGITAQKRSPVTHDIRIRGHRTGQIIGAGSLWHPGREDLDTALNKIFSYNLQEALVIKGPYSVRYGPGFNFVEMRLMEAPIADGGTPFGGVFSLDYESNGQHFVGRQHVFGGDDRWGVRVNYGHATGNDYDAGNGQSVPASFKSRDLYATIGHKISEGQRIDFAFIRLDQTDVEYPGLVYDINFLVTDGFEVEYADTSHAWGEFRTEAWYNRTRFEGDSRRPGKLKQLPDLATEFARPQLTTDVDGSSTGYRLQATTEFNERVWTFGTDISYLDQTLNDREIAGPNSGNNYPIPHSNSIDVGIFADVKTAFSPHLATTLGARADHASYTSSRIVPGTPRPIDRLKRAPLDQTFDLWAAYLASEYTYTDNVAWTFGMGASQRAPTMTELYAVQSFIGTLQRGLTFVKGDPTLRPERLQQLDLAVHWTTSRSRVRLGGFHSWIHDYITYDLSRPTARRGGLSTGVAMVNTDLATLAGFEFDAEFDASPSIQLFNKISFVEGRDHSRRKPWRLGGIRRSGRSTAEEPLPGIPPLEIKLGLRINDPSPDNLWNVELMGRFVDAQNRIATSLLERRTRSFLTADIRSYWKLTNRVDLFVGVENIADEFYREHLDYRAGKGLFRRGRSWYFGTDVSF